MSVPALPPLPRLEVIRFSGHPLISSYIELVDGDLALLALRDNHEHAYVLDPLDFDAQLRLGPISGELELYKLLADRIRHDGICERGLRDIAELAPDLWLSPRSSGPWPMNTLIGATDRDAQLADADVCRDDDCDGDHVWWVVDFPAASSPAGYWVWHVNLATGLVVPPVPMALLPA